MSPAPDSTPVYLETGNKRTFAGAVEWPGWCRGRRDEESALQALFDYGLRYARVLEGTGLGFRSPAALSAFAVVERLKGDATTDFGAPGAVPAADNRPVAGLELERFQTVLRYCWNAFEEAARKAEGKELRLGPRGGGRNLEKMEGHVLEAHAAYLRMIGRKSKPDEFAQFRQSVEQTREATQQALASAFRAARLDAGQQRGARWPLRYFVRRAAWHILDHAWEIEDRIE